MRYNKKLAELLNHNEWYEQTEKGYFPTKDTPPEFIETIHELNKDFQNFN